MFEGKIFLSCFHLDWQQFNSCFYSEQAAFVAKNFILKGINRQIGS